MGLYIDQKAAAYLEAGALAVRTFGDIPAGLAHWRGVRLVVQAFEESLEVRQRDAEHYIPGEQEGTFCAARFPQVQQCLVLAGLHQEWLSFKRHFDNPYVTLQSAVSNNDYSPFAAEAKLHYAAWEGDMAVWEEAAPVIRKQYAWAKVNLVYFDLWAAVIQRDAAKLDSLLPEAEAAWTASRRRRNPDLWGGGGKVYNEFMIDRYTTTLLKIARRLGLQWQYCSKVSEQLWPEAVITHWDD
ncbi:hypothetical protein [Ideonella sp.]|uniref:hypothetical protein n=1 Tax=Ideonella sp. TaxID=1929293 RepID=UPI0037C01F81